MYKFVVKIITKMLIVRDVCIFTNIYFVYLINKKAVALLMRPLKMLKIFKLNFLNLLAIITMF